ncbi:MAG: response regulator transcription factor [Burkholderiales bacterium]|nr:response regulator transcription factor [Burkholderiales bacterium]
MRAMSLLPAYRVLLVDDHAMFRTGLKMVISTAMPDTEILEAGSLEAALSSVAGDVHVLLLDIMLKGLNGLEGLALLKRRWPLAPVLVLSSQDEPETVRLALSRGAAGFVSKAEPAEKIVEAIQLALGGHVATVQAFGDGAVQQRLTPRQCEVLSLLHQGLSNKLIARQLSLSDNTVRRHVQDILAFFDVASRTEAVFEARQRGLIH